MYLRQNEHFQSKLTYSPTEILIVLMLAIPTLFFGVYFTPIVEWANLSVNILVNK